MFSTEESKPYKWVLVIVNKAEVMEVWGKHRGCKT